MPRQLGPKPSIPGLLRLRLLMQLSDALMHMNLALSVSPIAPFASDCPTSSPHPPMHSVSANSRAPTRTEDRSQFRAQPHGEALVKARGEETRLRTHRICVGTTDLNRSTQNDRGGGTEMELGEGTHDRGGWHDVGAHGGASPPASRSASEWRARGREQPMRESPGTRTCRRPGPKPKRTRYAYVRGRRGRGMRVWMIIRVQNTLDVRPCMPSHRHMSE